jgi:hypothetical protein
MGGGTIAMCSISIFISVVLIVVALLVLFRRARPAWWSFLEAYFDNCIFRACLWYITRRQ